VVIFSVKNTLAYSIAVQITAVKYFSMQSSGVKFKGCMGFN
jgi:hypothetical protein